MAHLKKKLNRKTPLKLISMVEEHFFGLNIDSPKYGRKKVAKTISIYLRKVAVPLGHKMYLPCYFF